MYITAIANVKNIIGVTHRSARDGFNQWNSQQNAMTLTVHIRAIMAPNYARGKVEKPPSHIVGYE